MWKEYMEIEQEVKDKVRETKAELELNLASTEASMQTKGKLRITWVFSRWK